jgi:hypothetical protein
MRGLNVKGKSRSEVLPQTQAFAAQELLNRGWGAAGDGALVWLGV